MSDDPLFEHQRSYTRAHIHATLGGSVQSYLPEVAGKIVAICLKPDMNPGVPETVLIGKGEKIESGAARLVEQAAGLPTFIKRENNQWRFVGYYRATGITREGADFSRRALRARRTDVVAMLTLEAVVG